MGKIIGVTVMSGSYKKFFAIFAAIIFFASTACARLEQAIMSPAIDELERIIDELLILLQERDESIEAIMRENFEMRLNLIEIEHTGNNRDVDIPRQFWHGSEERVRESFLQFFHGDEMQAHLACAIGEAFEICEAEGRNEIFIDFEHLILRRSEMFSILFLFEYGVCHETLEITWRYIGYHVPTWNVGFAPAANRPLPRQLTERSEVEVRFYYWGPGDDMDSFPFVDATIRGEDLWSEAIRLAAEVTGVTVRDLWYDGRILYVDLPLNMNWNMRAGFGSTIWARAMIDTFYTFPDVDEVIFLFNGKNYPYIYIDFRINEPRGITWWEEEA
ncbi:MAG: hypothetical protein FWF80_08555 [Defluviitaleaceae bacterium]|nr:hypothetical protein [Defluviitaleaceae bacterium]